MDVQRFGARVAAGPRGHGVITVPFDPDELWGARAWHPVNGTVNDKWVRGTIAPGDRGWAFTLTPMWARDAGTEPLNVHASSWHVDAGLVSRGMGPVAGLSARRSAAGWPVAESPDGDQRDLLPDPDRLPLAGPAGGVQPMSRPAPG